MRWIKASAAIGAALTAAALTATAAPTANALASGNGPDKTVLRSDRAVDVEALREQMTATAKARKGSSERRGKPGTGELPVSDAELQAALDALIRDGAIGVTASVQTRQGSWSGAAGHRDVGSAQRAKSQDRFRIASNTKSLVATAVMQEVERGRLTLGTRVNTIVPGLLPGHDDVTIEHLLSHTSGLPTGTQLSIAKNLTEATWEAYAEALAAEYTDRELVADAIEMGWLFEPGTNFEYSNAGYVALGIVLEEVTGKRIDRLIERQVMRPARMQQSYFATRPGIRGASLRESFSAEGQWYSLRDFNPDLLSSAGAAVGTAKDLNRFDRSLHTGRLLSKELVSEMTTSRVGGYGLGLYEIPDLCDATLETSLWGHDGAALGTLSARFSSPDGARQVSLGVTGRYIEQLQQPYDLNAALATLVAATC